MLVVVVENGAKRSTYLVPSAFQLTLWYSVHPLTLIDILGMWRCDRQVGGTHIVKDM